MGFAKVAAAAVALAIGTNALIAPLGDHIDLSALPEIHQSGRHRVLSAAGNLEHGWRQLKAADDGSFPHVRDAHEFIGETQHGFVDLKYDVMFKPTTVNLGDYLGLLKGAGLACEAVSETELAVAVTFPADADAEAREHLVARLSQPGAAVAASRELMDSHPELQEGGSCADAMARPGGFFTVSKAEAASASSLALTLAPAKIDALTAGMTFSLEFDPDVERAVSKRRLEGKPEGRRLQRAAPGFSNTQVRNMGVNWNGQTGAAAAAAAASVPVIPGALLCKNCYAYFASSLTVTFDMCLTTTGVKYYYYDLTTGLGANSNPESGSNTIGQSPQVGFGKTFCKNIANAASAAGVTTVVNPTPNSWDMGMQASVKLTGAAGFGFNLATPDNGIAAAASTPGCASGDVMSCSPQVVVAESDQNQVSFTLTVGGVPIPVTIRPWLDAAGRASLVAPNFKLNLGASASVSADMGATITLTGVPSTGGTLTPIISPSTKFDATFSKLPFVFQGLDKATGTIEMALFPNFKVTIFNFVPFKLNTPQKVALTIAAGAKTSRVLRYGRELAAPATCATGSAALDTAYTAAQGMQLLPITSAAILDALKVPSSVATLINNVANFKFPADAITLINPSTATVTTTGALAAEATGCVGPNGVSTTADISGGVTVVVPPLTGALSLSNMPTLTAAQVGTVMPLIQQAFVTAINKQGASLGLDDITLTVLDSTGKQVFPAAAGRMLQTTTYTIKFSIKNLSAALLAAAAAIPSVTLATEINNAMKTAVAASSLDAATKTALAAAAATVTVDAPAANSSSGLSTGAIIGIAVGCSVGGIALIALAVFAVMHRKRAAGGAGGKPLTPVAGPAATNVANPVTKV